MTTNEALAFLAAVLAALVLVVSAVALTARHYGRRNGMTDAAELRIVSNRRADAAELAELAERFLAEARNDTREVAR